MKEERKIDLKKFICSTIFNIVEVAIIIIMGMLMKVPIEIILILFVLFCIARMTCYKPMHYKSPVLCMIWSTSVFCSFFALANVNVFLAISMTVFGAVVLTGKGDIKDCFMYERNEEKQKYRELKRFVREFKDTEQLKKFEELLKGFNKKYEDRFKINLYEVYYLIFYKELSYAKVLKKMHLRDDNHIIINALDMIFICFDTYIQLENCTKSEINKELAKKS